MASGVPGLARLVQRPIQEVPLADFVALEESDILFIDSTHVVAIGSDVVYECLEILPRLPPGVLVHFHDIFLPNEYPREWIERDRWFWNEQYLVQAFLAFNSKFEVVWGSAFMEARHPEALDVSFNSRVAGQQGGSLWLRRLV